MVTVVCIEIRTIKVQSGHYRKVVGTTVREGLGGETDRVRASVVLPNRFGINRQLVWNAQFAVHDRRHNWLEETSYYRQFSTDLRKCKLGISGNARSHGTERGLEQPLGYYLNVKTHGKPVETAKLWGDLHAVQSCLEEQSMDSTVFNGGNHAFVQQLDNCLDFGCASKTICSACKCQEYLYIPGLRLINLNKYTEFTNDFFISCLHAL